MSKIGPQVTSLDSLMILADEKKSVYWMNAKAIPAAVVIGMPLRTVGMAIRNGRIHLYDPKGGFK